MLATVHLLTGAMLGATLPNTAAVVIVSILSHYVLDALPHIDPDTFRNDKTQPYSRTQIAVFAIDAISVLTFLFLFFNYRQQWLPIIIGSLAAQLPDLLMPLEGYTWYAPFAKAHQLCHWNKQKAHLRHWFLIGIVSQVTFSVLALWIMIYK